MIKGVHHVALTVRGGMASAQFYVDAASMSLCTEAAPNALMPTLPGIGDSWMLRSSNAYLRILETSVAQSLPNPPRPVSEAGIVHVCLQSPVVSQVQGSFSGAGAGFHGPMVDLGTGFLYAYARDVEGNVVELEGVAPVWADATPWVAHVSYSSHDRDRLAQFYALVLGGDKALSPDIGPRGALDKISGMAQTRFRAAWMPTANMQVEVIQYLNPATNAHVAPRKFSDLGYSYVAFEVTDLLAERARLLAAGAGQSDDLVALSTEQHCFLTDPDGNLLMLLCLRAEDGAHGIANLPDPAVVDRMNTARATLLKKATH